MRGSISCFAQVPGGGEEKGKKERRIKSGPPKRRESCITKAHSHRFRRKKREGWGLKCLLLSSPPSPLQASGDGGRRIKQSCLARRRRRRIIQRGKTTKTPRKSGEAHSAFTIFFPPAASFYVEEALSNFCHFIYPTTLVSVSLPSLCEKENKRRLSLVSLFLEGRGVGVGAWIWATFNPTQGLLLPFGLAT